MNRSLTLGFLVFSSVLAACAHHTSDEDTDTTSMKLETSCSRTLCDALQASSSAEEDQCFDAADMADGDPSMCVTSSPTCTDDDRKTCESTNWKFDVRAEPDAAYQAACERSREHMKSCNLPGYVDDSANCATFAKVERPELANLYDCVTATPCDQLSSPNACVPPLGTLGDELCQKLATLSGACSDDGRALLNEESAWVKDDVIAAARGCEKALTATDMSACIVAWLAVVSPTVVSD